MRPCFYLTLLFTFLLTACQPEFQPLKKNYDDLPAFTEKGIHVVVEIPAGTNHLVAFNPQTHRFENQRDNNQPRVVNFLPFPGNYGFIPGTRHTAPEGGETRPPRVLVIGESVPTGTLLEARPLAALILREAGVREIQIVAVPADSSQNVLQVFDFQEFAIEKQAAQRLVEDWFVNRKPPGTVTSAGWRNAAFARREIEKWQVSDSTD